MPATMERMDNQPNGNTGEGQEGYSYGKRPLWQWVLVYVVLGGIAYIAIYYFFIAGSGGYSYGSTDASTPAPASSGQWGE